MSSALRVIDTDDWSDTAKTLAGRVEQRDRVALRLSAGRERFMASVARQAPSALHVFVPEAVDQTESTLLTLGSALGAEVAQQIDSALRTDPEHIQIALDVLDHYLGDRPLLIDGWDVLGSAGTNREFGTALGDRGRTVRQWMAERPGLFLGDGLVPNSVALARVPLTPPTSLINGVARPTKELWEGFGGDITAYSLALAAQALGATEGEVADRRADDIRSLIAELSSPALAGGLKLLAVHARPLPRPRLEASVGAETVRLGIDLGLWSDVRDGVLVEDGWVEWVNRQLSPEETCELHQRLAGSFLKDYQLDDPTLGRVGLSVLEAHRHLVGAGDLAQAREHARYGPALLIEAAQRFSLGGKYREAAELYAHVIEAGENQRKFVLPPKVRGYARHYLHFNRARGEMEGLAATVDGYRAAVQDWPGNALFWSRLVRTLCYQDRLGDAEDELDNAQQEVEEHPQKQTFLIARTVSGLLRHRRLLEAALIWNDYRPDTPMASAVETTLRRDLDAGWMTRQLVIDPQTPLVFTRDVNVRIGVRATAWSAEIVGLALFADGLTPVRALEALIARARDEVRRLVRAYTPDLSPSERLRKRLLLGAVDVRASLVDAQPPDSYWFFGTLERGAEGALWLHTGGARSLRFEIPSAVADAMVVDEREHLARVKTDERGLPTGPVLEIEPGFQGSDEDLWAAWRRLAGDAD